MRPSHIYTTTLLFSTTVSAWPSWLGAPVEAVKREIQRLEMRADASTTTTSFDLSFSSSASDSSTASSATVSATTTGSNTGSASTSGSTSGSTTDSSKTSATTHKSSNATTTTFDQRLGAGGISMITPNPISGATYYKIKDYVTFAWNYTSLSVTPSAIDILAYGAKNSVTYTLAMNQTISASTQAFTWDTEQFQSSATVPLLTETYTLIIHDAGKDASAAAVAGYLGTANQFTFGMYLPKLATPLSEFVCAVCSGAPSSMEKTTMSFVFGMVAITVLSFSWFTGVAGLW